MRMRLGLLQDPAVIDRQIKKELQAAEAARQKAATPTVKTEAEMIAEEELTEKEKEAIRKKAEERTKPRIRPLSEQKAIEMGANFAAETFIFAVGIGVIVFEQWRQRRKARNARDDIREDLEEMQAELKVVKAELEEMDDCWVSSRAVGRRMKRRTQNRHLQCDRPRIHRQQHSRLPVTRQTHHTQWTRKNSTSIPR
jgi:hypothetical protein